MINRMQADKKTIAGSLRVILPTGFGTANVVKNPPREALEAGWREIGC
jgi:3-dehydroquinate synthetase